MDTKQYLQEIEAVIKAGPYHDNWESLSQYQVPKWYKDAKFGIFIHWGAFTVPEFGKKYPYNEYRASWKAAGLPLMQRLCDKQHSWGDHGLAALVPDALAQGIMGYPFCCADMVGGGEYLNFWENADRLDGELFVRHSAVSCLMPAIQFSAAPWRVLSEEDNRRIHCQLALRKAYWGDIWQAMERCRKTGEPVVRYMEYEFPH